MKNVLIISVINIILSSHSISSQNYIDSINPFFKKNDTQKFILKTSRMEDRASLLPSPQLKRFKVKSDMFESETKVTLYLEEYCENKKVETNDDLLESRSYTNNTIFSAEIVPDTSNTEKLTIYTLLPGTISYKYRTTNKERVFKSVPFSKKCRTEGKDIPIIFLYEDDLSNKTEKIISKYITNDSLSVLFNQNNKPYSQIDRYITIFYNTTPNK